ncbi:MAG: dicarboxylate/amino acid:cation symporter [Phycisphaerales bacterium]|nr:MAG: dicarboxylate/amino acid:cation symporter [Phycisphaerales bacterium]
MRIKLHNLIFIGMVAGVLIGLGLWALGRSPDETHQAVCTHMLWWLDLFGPTVFMGALKMIIAPLILASIVSGVTSLPDMKELGAIGWKTLAYYFCTTSIAVVIGLVLVLSIGPGKKAASLEVRNRRVAELEARRQAYQEMAGRPALSDDGVPTADYLAWLAQEEGEQRPGDDEAGRFEKLAGARDRTAGDIFKDDIVSPLLMNPFQSLSANPPNSLGIIFFALLLGIACMVVGKRAGHVVSFFQGLNAVIMHVTHWLMSISPFAIGCIMAGLVARNGPEIFQTLGWYCGTVIGGIVIHVGVLVTIAAVIGGVRPLRLFQGIREAYMIAFTTRSSAATLPVTIANTTEKLNVSPKVANFSLPLGATVNMDGTALYEGVAVIFLIQIYGGLDDVSITMTAMATFLIFITAVLASVGAAAVPDAGLVTMVLVASAVHLPIYYIPLIFAVDAFLDMFRTSTNVLGDSVGAIVVNRLERSRLGSPAGA